MGRIMLALRLMRVFVQILYKRIRYRQLYILISTPCYGNVGDHTIELAQQEILRDCGVSKNSIDISSIEYFYLKSVIRSLVRRSDIIIIDGGGNFGDTWPDTIRNINDVVLTYCNNRIFIFPESWYFSDTEKGNHLLDETIEAFDSNRNVILYARDSWSYREMKRNLKNTLVRYSFDMVLFKDFSAKHVSNEKLKVGLSIRDDKEAVNTSLTSHIRKDLADLGVDTLIINNDTYEYTEKKYRKAFFETIIRNYEICDIIITDRFHGFIFAILCHKPCLIVDNLTGKIMHFYEDIRSDISGCACVNSESYTKEVLVNFLESKRELVIFGSFYSKRDKFLAQIKDDIVNWRE